MRQRKIHVQIIEREVISGISDDIIEHLQRYPADHVECVVTKVIFDEVSILSDKTLGTIVKALASADERDVDVDLLVEILDIFIKTREELVKGVIEYTRQKWEPPNDRERKDARIKEIESSDEYESSGKVESLKNVVYKVSRTLLYIPHLVAGLELLEHMGIPL